MADPGERFEATDVTYDPEFAKQETDLWGIA
jgi:hypothetical protein